MSGILINSRTGLLTAVILSVHIFIFYYLASHQIITPNHSWKNDTFNLLDVIEYSSLLIFAALFSWLSNSQLEKTLIKYKESEALLQHEKENLEIKVKERTEEIKALQIEKINSMYRLVEFGRISSGLFHDIMSPLTNITLNLQMLKIDEVKEEIKNLTPSIKKIDNLITQSRKHIKIDNTYTHFDVGEEITSVMEILKSKAISNGVKLIFPIKNLSARLYGSQTLFSHIIMNLLSNGIDAYSTESKTKNKLVIIKIKRSIQDSSTLYIKVSDNGEGISPELIKNIFEPFFTTKQERGCGIGLSSTKHILEKYFNGSISVRSMLGKGTTFTMSIPLSIIERKTTHSNS
jgi:signal transduction histidine kinase